MNVLISFWEGRSVSAPREEFLACLRDEVMRFVRDIDEEIARLEGTDNATV